MDALLAQAVVETWNSMLSCPAAERGDLKMKKAQRKTPDHFRILRTGFEATKMPQTQKCGKLLRERAQVSLEEKGKILNLQHRRGN